MLGEMDPGADEKTIETAILDDTQESSTISMSPVFVSITETDWGMDAIEHNWPVCPETWDSPYGEWVPTPPPGVGRGLFAVAPPPLAPGYVR